MTLVKLDVLAVVFEKSRFLSLKQRLSPLNFLLFPGLSQLYLLCIELFNCQIIYQFVIIFNLFWFMKTSQIVLR